MAHIDRVLNNGRLLLRLINDTLEISRYDAGRMKLQLTPIRLPIALATVVEIIEPFANAKALEIALECDPLQRSSGDRLLALAANYHQLGQQRRSLHPQPVLLPIKTELIARQILDVSVITDTGIGIGPEDGDRIFQPYFRADSSLSSGMPDSTGLGLATVARLVNLLQGKIELVSEVGVGSCFTVIFPLELME